MGISFSVVVDILRESSLGLVDTMLVNIATDETPVKPLRCDSGCAVTENGYDQS